MRLTLGSKAFLAFVLTTLVILSLTALAVHWSFQRGLMDYVNDLRSARIQTLVQRLGERYAEDDSWEFLRRDPTVLRALMRRGRPVADAGTRRQREHALRQHLDRTLTPVRDPIGGILGIAVLDAAGERVVGPRRPHGNTFDVIVNDAIVGRLIVPVLHSLSDEVDLHFAARQSRWLAAIFAAGIALAALVAWFFSRQLTRPVRALTAGTHALSEGRYGETIDVAQRDELGRLASDFNALSKALARNREQRRELMADVSHELRTPLAALRGQVSALRDGVRSANDETLGALDAQVTRLSALVDELYELSLADSGALDYRMQPVDLSALLRRTSETFASRLADGGVALEVDLPDEAIHINGDRRRLEQMLANLLENTARYTDAGGRARLRAHDGGAAVTITLDDSIPGVPEDALPHLFERLYRVEKSRSRASGGAGLGLALVERIATAHGGRVHAAPSELGGLCVTVTLSAHNG